VHCPRTKPRAVAPRSQLVDDALDRLLLVPLICGGRARHTPSSASLSRQLRPHSSWDGAEMAVLTAQHHMAVLLRRALALARVVDRITIREGRQRVLRVPAGRKVLGCLEYTHYPILN
jgi:hypothetical protein